MIKLLATDLDGTLFYPKRKFTLMTRKNAKFLKDFYNAGGKVMLVTGRNYNIASKVEKKLGIPIAIVGCNGSFVYENGKYVETYPMDNQKVLKLYNEMKNKYGTNVWIVYDETDALKITVHFGGKFIQSLAKIGNKFNFAYAEKNVAGEKAFIDALTNGKLFKLMPVFGLKKDANEKMKLADIALNDLYKDDFTIVGQKNAMEITAKGVNKAKSLEEYLRINNISKDEVAVIGDSENDLVMFDSFNNSFCMSHAEEDIKKRAKHIVDSVSDLRDYLLDEKGNLK